MAHILGGTRKNISISKQQKDTIMYYMNRGMGVTSFLRWWCQLLHICDCGVSCLIFAMVVSVTYFRDGGVSYLFSRWWCQLIHFCDGGVSPLILAIVVLVNSFSRWWCQLLNFRNGGVSYFLFAMVVSVA